MKFRNPFRRGAGLKNYVNARDLKSENKPTVTIKSKDRATPAIYKASRNTQKAFTKKRERDSMNTLSKNIKKGNTKMRNKIKQLHINLSEYRVYQQVCLFSTTLWRVARMIAPALIGGYLIWIYDNRIIVALGVAGILYSVIVVVNSAYLAEKSLVSVPAKKRK